MYDKDLFKPLLKKLESECMSTDTCLIKGNRKSISGWFWNSKVFGYLTYEGSYEPTIKISFLSLDSYYEYLTESEEEKFCLSDVPSSKSNCKISVFSRYGNWKSFNYSRIL